MANTVDKVIAIAEAEVGYLEKKSNKNLDHKTKNAGSANYTKYGRDMHNLYPAVMDFPAAWCDCFVDWCFQMAYGVSNAKKLLCGNFDDYTIFSVGLYKDKKAWYTSNPKVGDQIFFKNLRGTICHTGLVYKVDKFYVYTIEGNTSGASGVVANGGGVCKKMYGINSSQIAGYGRPKYDVEEKKTTTTTKATKKKTSKKDTVLGYDSAKKFNKKYAKKWTVTADVLNMRTGAGTNKSVITTLKNGTKVQCYGYYTNSGVTPWLLVQSGKHTGYCSKKYLK